MRKHFRVSGLRRHYLTICATILLVAGIIVLVTPPAYFWYKRIQGNSQNQQHWAHAAPLKAVNQGMLLGTPVSLSLPRLGIDLKLEPGQYSSSTKMWSLDSTHAFYVLPGKEPLSDKASPFIYGHYRKNVFANLKGAAVGEPLYVTNSTGATLAFKFTGSIIVDPSRGDIINRLPNDKKSLYLLTCVSPFFTSRQIFHFEYMGQKQAV
jgi:LPXTG-site transpeptidase (sortase) family protein